MKVLFSFLGASPYSPIRYYLPGDPSNVSKKVPYVEEAIIELLGPFDKVIVFGTEKSRQENWEKRVVKIHEDGTRDYKVDGLELRLNKLSEEGKIGEMEFVKIPLGKQEGEIWKIVERLYEKASEIEDNSSLYFDVTHCFRSIPLISLIFLEFVRQMRNFEVRILYGAYDAKEDDRAPIIDLTVFEEGLRWIYAVKEFLKLGISSEFFQILETPAKELRKRLKKKGAPLENLVREISKFSKEALSCQAKEAIDSVDRILKLCEGLELLEESPPEVRILLGGIIEKVKEEMDPIRENSENYNRCLALAEWALSKDHLQQAATYLREGVVSLVIQKKFSKDRITDVDLREKVEDTLNKFSKTPTDIGKLWSKIRTVRNAINHAWMTREKPSSKLEDVRKLLEECLKGAKDLYDKELEVPLYLLKERKIFIRCGSRFNPPDESWEVITLPEYISKENLRECVEIVRRKVLEDKSPVKLLISGPIVLGVAIGQALEHVPVEITYVQLNQRTKRFEEWFSNVENI